MIGDLLDIAVTAIGEVVFVSWRLFLCILLAAVIITCVYLSLDSRLLCLAIAVPVAIAGLICGLHWHSRHSRPPSS